ncbi:MAG: hypothetical protein JST23_11050 [Bacteroidetes bacterium]|nr:hypothetical protein [Bacteroidota bacterium]
MAVESTINALVGQGLSSNVIAPVQKILTDNITTGGSYAKFQEQLQNHILQNETGEGNLQRYTKQITTDAINQYNAQYGETVAQDLQFSWGRYIGSNLTTSREFCVLLTDKQWVHKSELPEIIKGHIDGTDCKLSKTTGLPLGMIPDTDADNFKVRRGGYNCGHQFFWVPDSAVPADVKDKFESKNKAPNKISTNTFVDTIEFNRKTLHEINSGNIMNVSKGVKVLLSDWGEDSNNIRRLPESDISKQWLNMSMEEGVTKYTEIYRGVSYVKTLPDKVAKYNYYKNNYKQGAIIQYDAKTIENNKEYDNRFLSGTSNRMVAERKFGKLHLNEFHSVIFTIRNLENIRGLDVNGLTGYTGIDNEYEVIFGDRFTYEVVTSKEIDGNLFIELLQHNQ